MDGAPMVLRCGELNNSTASCGYDRIDEGRLENGRFVPGRLLNGDERNAFCRMAR